MVEAGERGQMQRGGVCVYVRRPRVALLRVLMFLLESKPSGSIAQAFRRNDRLPAGYGRNLQGGV